jgi:hypothetical protein
MTGFLVTEQKITGEGYDTVMGGGVAMFDGMDMGPLEHMISIHFRPVAPVSEAGVVGTLCFDSAGYVPPGEADIFVDQIGGAVVIENIDCFRCWPVKMICGNPNGDNDVNVGDPVFMINYIFRGGPPPVPWQLGDANCDGDINVADAIFLVHAAFRTGPLPECCE